jgi:hypothetical protein
MKYYIEKDEQNRVVTKGITSDDAIIEKPLVEVTKEEFNTFEQYIPPFEEPPKEQTLKEEVEELKQLIADLASLQLGV